MKALPQRVGAVVGLLLTVPLLMAWLAIQVLPILGRDQHSAVLPSSDLSMYGFLLWGPLLETALLLLASASVTYLLARRKFGRADNTATCTGIIGLSFVASHLLQNGTAALASLPMAILLSAGAAHAVQQFHILVIVRVGLALFAIHALYNASLLSFSGALF